MANYRRNRINEEVQKELCEILREVKDPRVTSAFVTINAARVTPDLKYAKIYFGIIVGDPEEVQKGLECASGFLRTSLAKRLNLRQTPELSFIYDRSAEHGAHIAQVLKDLNVNGTENKDQ